MQPQAEHTTEFYLAVVADKDSSPQRDEAARQLVDRLTPIICGILHRYGLRAQADDAVGDLCLKIVQGALGYDAAGGRRFRDYIAACAHNWAKDYFRRLDRRRGGDTPTGDSDVHQRLLNEADKTCEEISSLLSDAVDNEMLAKLRAADRLAREELSDSQQAIIGLVYDELLKPKVAAAQLGARPNEVHLATFHYRKRLKEIFLELRGAISWAREK